MAEVWDPSRPLGDPGLASSRQKMPDLLGAAYWRRLAAAAGADLHVEDAKAQAKALTPRATLPRARCDDLRRQICGAGVAQVSAPELALPPRLVSVLARGVEGVLRAGWPASMIVMYDEAWELIERLSGLIKEATGNACNMDVLAWYVDPNRGDAGFSPHRDRQPDDAAATFRPDGSAMYTTAWVALTDAEPGNSCLYVIPSYADPGYHEGDPEEEDAPDPLQRALANKEAYQHIRALPCPAGAAALFTHRIIHWGSRGRAGHPAPRISISFGCADDGYEPPYFDRSHLPFPPLALRLALASAQQLVYHERFPATARQLALFHDAFKAQAALFDPTYAKKVKAEFLGAIKDHEARKAAAAAGGSGAAESAKAAAAVTEKPPGGKAAAAAGGKAAKPAAAANGKAGGAAACGAEDGARPGRKRGAAGGGKGAAAAAEEAAEEPPPPKKRARGKQAAAKEAEEEGRGGGEAGSGKRGKQKVATAAEVASSGAARKGGKTKAAAPPPAAAAAAAKAERGSKSKARRAGGASGGDDAGGGGGDDEGSSSEEEGGDELMAAIEEIKRRQKGKASGGGGGGCGDGDDRDAGAADEDDDEDLVDLALEEMLDAVAGSGDDFEVEDDYEDE